MQNKQPLSFHWIRDDEPKQVLRIGRECFGVDAWSEERLYRFLQTTNRIPKVMTVDGEVVGYLLYALLERAVVIKQIAVAPVWQRQGYGTRMVDYLKGNLRLIRRRLIGVEISEHNLAAQLFFKSCGFCWFRTRKLHSGDDAYRMKFVMQRSSPPHLALRQRKV